MVSPCAGFAHFADSRRPAPSASIGLYEVRFLLWLLEKTAGDLYALVPSTEFGVQEHIPVPGVEAVVGNLQDQGWVRTRGHRGGGPLVGFEEAGREEALRLQDERANPQTRAAYAVNAVLTWVMAQHGRRPLRIQEFFVAREIFFHGEALSADEVVDAVSYLASEGLLECAGPSFRGQIASHVSLTTLGLDCALAGSDVSAFVERRRHRDSQRPVGNSVQVTFEGPVGSALVGDHHTLNVSSPASQLAAVVSQFGAALGLDEAQLRTLLRDADELRQAGHAPAPEDQGRLRRTVEGIRNQLSAAPDTAGRQLMLDAVTQTLTRLLGG